MDGDDCLGGLLGGFVQGFDAPAEDEYFGSPVLCEGVGGCAAETCCELASILFYIDKK